jgi:hypothetical protein
LLRGALPLQSPRRLTFHLARPLGHQPHAVDALAVFHRVLAAVSTTKLPCTWSADQRQWARILVRIDATSFLQGILRDGQVVGVGQNTF